MSKPIQRCPIAGMPGITFTDSASPWRVFDAKIAVLNVCAQPGGMLSLSLRETEHMTMMTLDDKQARALLAFLLEQYAPETLDAVGAALRNGSLTVKTS